MGNHRQAQRGLRRRRRAAFLAGAMLLTGVVALLVAVVRADLTSSPLGPVPAAASPAATAESAVPTGAVAPNARFDGTWTGRLADPDTTTVDVRLVVDGRGGVRVDVPSLGCAYRGQAATPGAAGTATADLRVEGDPAPPCLDSARIRLGAEGQDGTGPRAARVRYDLVASCADERCLPRRATGVLDGR